MHVFRLAHKNTPKTAASTLLIIRRAYPVGIFAENTGNRGQHCARRLAASLDLLSASPFERQHLHRHLWQSSQVQGSQTFVQVKCFHGKAKGSSIKGSAETLEQLDDPLGAGSPHSSNQSRDLPDEYTSDRSVCMESASSSRGNAAHVGLTKDADSLASPPSEALSEAQRTFGRRRRCIRGSSTATEVGSRVSSSTGFPTDKREIGVEQAQANDLIVGRRRGRAARTCLKAAAAWLGAVLPQVSSADACRYSAAAAVVMLARGGRIGHSAVPSTAASASDAAEQQTGHWQRPCAASGGNNAEPSQPQGLESSGGEAAGNKLAATHVATDPAAATGDQPQCAKAPPSIGRRQRERISLGHLGPPGTPDATSGGAMDFQFPILFNKAIKRLLKPLFRRTGQLKRQACSRTVSASTPALAVTAAAGAARSIQRPRLLPRVLLRSWRPLSKAQSVVGPRHTINAQEQHLQTLQRQLLQGGSVVNDQPRAAAATQQLQQQLEQQQQQQHEEKASALVEELAAPLEQNKVLSHVAADEEALPAVPAASEPAAAAISGAPKGVEGKYGGQDEDGPKGTLLSRVDAYAPDVLMEQKNHEQQSMQQEKEKQLQKETGGRPAAAEPTVPLKKAVRRGASRTGPARRPLPICFVRQRISTHYGNLRSFLAPYCNTISEWTYRNGNVVVTVGSLLSLTATLMADMRLLRTFNLLAGFCYFSYNWSRRPRLTDAALWNVVFLVLNTVMLWRVHTEHREVSFSSDELDIFQRYFLPAGMSPRQFRRLLRQGSWQTFPQGYVLQQEDKNCETLCFVARGAVEISQGGEIVDTYRGGETGAVLGVEPFLSYVADLRRLSAKRVKHTAASTPETLASHADESPEGLQRHQQTLPTSAVGNGIQQASSDHKQQRQQRQHQQNPTTEGGDRTSNLHLVENTERNVANESTAATVAGQDANTSSQQQQTSEQKPPKKLSKPLLEPPGGGNLASLPPLAVDGSSGTPDSGGETLPGTSIVAAAAEAAASAAAAVCTAAATALSTDAPQAPETLLPARAHTKASTATARVQGGVSSAAEGARHVAEAAAAAAAAAVAAAADAASLTEPSQSRKASTQALRERSPSLKGESEEADGPREEGTVTAPSTATCITETTVFCLDLKELAAFVLREPGNLGFPVVQGLTTLLVNRSRAQAARLAILSYDAFLAGVFADGVVQTGERKMLEEFRRKRAISQTQHEQALARLGWTPEEFERGSQASTGLLSRMAFGLGSFLRGSPESHGTADVDRQQLHQGNTPRGNNKDGDAFHCVLPPLLEDWELVEDERAVPPQRAPGDRRPATGAANTVDACTGTECFGDAVSYAFEADTASFH